jgi:hypothetical protein
MKKLTTFILLFTFAFFGFSFKTKKFPEFEYLSIHSEKINNSIFKNKKSVVVIGHIGCPPFMQFVKDCQDSNVDDSFQMIFILENTNSQIIEFNSSEVNNWSNTRKVFGLKPLDGTVIGECSNDNLKYVGRNLIVSSQCRRISKKLHTQSSLSIYSVNNQGLITSKIKGYLIGLSSNERLEYILNRK